MFWITLIKLAILFYHIYLYFRQNTKYHAMYYYLHWFIFNMTYILSQCGFEKNNDFDDDSKRYLLIKYLCEVRNSVSCSVV